MLAGNDTLSMSRNPYDWLGDGIYLFEDDWRHAVYFAQRARDNPARAYTRRPIRQHAVIGVALRIRLWLDMCTQEGIHEYVDAHTDLQNSGTSLRVNRRSQDDDPDLILRPMDRQIINHIHALRRSRGQPSYDAVRSHFVQGSPLLETAGFKRDTHVQLALRNQDCVLGYFMVREAEF